MYWLCDLRPFLLYIQAVCECVPPSFFDAITWLGYCNSTMNPIIYPMFMRDFKRALARLLPCCSSSQAPRRPSLPLSLSLRNSGEPQLATEPPSLVSDPPQLPATATDAVNLFDAEHAGIELPLLLPNQVDTLDDWHCNRDNKRSAIYCERQDVRLIGFWKNVLKRIMLKKINGISINGIVVTKLKGCIAPQDRSGRLYM